MDDRRLESLIHDTFNGRLSRRDVLRRAGTLGLSVPVVAALLAACGSSNTASTPTASTGAAGTTGTPAATAVAGTPAASAAATSAATTTPAATPAASPSASTGVAYTKDNPPSVANAAAAKQYSGQTITYYGDSVGIGHDLDVIVTGQFTKDTGINVKVIQHPQSSTDTYATYLRFFQAKSPDIDVMMLDVIWPGAFAPHLMDLSQAFASEKSQYYDTIITNNTVNGKLVAIPWFGDFGMLFYRTDLLQKYGFTSPPATWDDLENQARTIMTGEHGRNSNFWGFVFQGDAYEGLTCDALEWLASTGGGSIIQNGQVTLNNPNAIQILNQARSWVGTIAPRGVTSYLEEDARNVFQGGNAAFMRNWPYAYALANSADSPVNGKVDVAPLPASAGQPHVGTVGGWQLGVSAYSKVQAASIELVRYMASPEVESYRAQIGSFVPTIAAVAADPEVIKAEPFLQKLQSVTRVTRPSGETGANYNQVSTYFFQGVNQILNGANASQQVPQITQQIQRVVG
ncbi:MAG TPA: ABC transporter substrate-binding protein [Thermomicrobiaceae bacterium]|nr:ABC transporter substrate-binding protein [Thermomicrobiaceae bacterium]